MISDDFDYRAHLLEYFGSGSRRVRRVSIEKASKFWANCTTPRIIIPHPLPQLITTRGATAHSRAIRKTTTSLRLPYIFTSALGRFQLRAAGSAFVLAHKAEVNSTSVSCRTLEASRHFSTSSNRHRSRMPPKKKEEEKKVLLGRPGNSLKSGIVRRMPSPFSLWLSPFADLKIFDRSA